MSLLGFSNRPTGVIQEKWGTVVKPNYLLAHIENIGAVSKESAPPRPRHERHRPEQILLYRILDRHYPEFLGRMALVESNQLMREKRTNFSGKAVK